ncbi:MAG: cytochrome C oxidase subunit IV family protein [Planctomycetota bacterium]
MSKDHAHHITSPMTLIATFTALVALTLLTSVLGQPEINLGRADIWVTLGIATLKAGLVALFFMHLLHDKAFNGLILMSTMLFVTLFVCITLMDSRQYKDRVESYTQDQQEIQQQLAE